ncbi:hypothetical protein CNYM01_00005 [Colletotrichum nymphaeae SA-01]|uniref:Aminotransferase class-III n=1 Tax=Colletotrichum nymphaeae SA-01 TaxID=1460502 RepID=A0A135UJF5_9PEZI|nr:hypothetical protein CNYM01_00005 [Colletotrichum nymphaeae SA-01]
MAFPAGLPLRKLDHNFNNGEGSILSFDQMRSLTMANPLWREFINNRLALERRYGQLLHLYEEKFSNYFGGFMPIHYGTLTSSTMDPETVVKIILTVAELSMSESSESSESPFTDEDDTLKRLGWEDIQAKQPCWALLSDTSKSSLNPAKCSIINIFAEPKSSLKYSDSPKPYGSNPTLLHIDGVSDDELRDQLFVAREAGCIGIFIELVETQFNGRVLDPSLLSRLSVMCAEYQLLLAVDETLTAIRCGAPFCFQREEYFDVISPDLVFFGKATGSQGIAISFDGQFVKKFGLSGTSRGRAVRKWQNNFQKPLPTADLIQAMATIEIAVQGKFVMLSRIIGQSIRDFVLEQAAERGHEVTPPEILGGLESLIFVRKDIAGEMLVMGAKTAGSWIPWVKWLPRLEKDMTRSEVLEEIIGGSSGSAREELSNLLTKRGSKPTWCFWCGNRTTAKKDDWCRRCCIGMCEGERSTLRSVKNQSSRAVSFIVHIFRGGLFSPPTLTYDPLLLLLNHDDQDERNKLTEKWKDNKLQELNFVGVVSALLANVLTSTGSWPNLLPPETTTPWPVRTCWFCGIAFALASVLTAADQTIRLHRMAGHRDGLVLIRQSLRTQDRVLIGTEWKYRPRKTQVYAWQLSVLFLAGAVLCMISGMIFLVWSAVAEDIGRGKGFDDNGKVAVIFTSFALITAIIFALGQTTLYYPVPKGGDIEDSD